MLPRVLAAALAICSFAFAQAGTYTINQLREFLRSTIQQKTPDVEVAKFLRGVRLSERLDDRTIEDLQGQGLGPKTVAVLHNLGATTASLPKARPEPPPPPPPPQKPPPSSEEQAQIIEDARENSLNYTRNLPNYICWQVTTWNVNPYGHEDSFVKLGTMVETLSYVDGREEYQTKTVNDQVSNVDPRKLGHSLSRGEFASMLKEIFERRTRTQFEWARWSGLRGHWMYVFSFRVPQETSQYSVMYNNGAQHIVAAYHGEIYIDRDTRMVVRIKMYGDIPQGFPVQNIYQQLDYDYSKIGDQEFLLPLVSEMRGRIDGKFVVRNTIDFRHYEKFSADAKIKFESMGADETAPGEDKMKEQAPPPK
jgi:hypothetical protein